MRLCGYCSARDMTQACCERGYLQAVEAPCEDTAPYAMFRFNGEVVILTRRQFVEATGTPCKCGSCLCCRAKEYEKEVKSGR